TRLVGIGVAVAPGEAAYIPVGHQPALGGPPQLEPDTVLGALAPLFADLDIAKVAHNGKFDMAHLEARASTIDIKGFAFDTLLGVEPMEKELRELAMWDLFTNIEMPLVPVLARMEAQGIALDVSVLRDMSQGLVEQIRVLEEEAYHHAGQSFNIGSPAQLST